MNNGIKKELYERIEELQDRKYSNEEYNCYLQGLLMGLRMVDAITQDERYYILDKYSK